MVDQERQSSHLLNFLLLFNFFALLWVLRFMQVDPLLLTAFSSFYTCLQVITDNIVANFASTWQKEGGGKMSFGETGSLLLSSAKKVFCLQMIAEAAFPVLPFLEELRRPGQDAL